MIFFFGYMIGSLVFGVLSDKYIDSSWSVDFRFCITFMLRFGRRPIMGISFFIISFASFLCAFAPQDGLGFELSYSLFVLGRFLLACASRGVALTGFVIGT